MSDDEERRVAAAAWSRIAEPGDVAAGELRAQLGDVGALRWLRDCVAAGGSPSHLPYLQRHGAATDAGQSEQWRLAVGRWSPRLERVDPHRDLAALERLGGRLVIPGDAEWPDGLDDLGPAAPPALWVRGEALLGGPQVALVGARASTSYGEHVAAGIAVGVADAGLGVCSGGAYGVDAAGHRGALTAGGQTVAVLAGGVDRLYPAGNADLLRTIMSQGAVVAEVPPGMPPARFRFLQRNRIIAAMSAVVVVVEAAWRSGALSTAHHAAELLRPVAVVPGPVTSMASAGCHRLLRETDAVCVTDAADVLELVAAAGEQLTIEPDVPTSIFDDLDERAYRVLDALPARAASDIAGVIRASGLAAAEVRGALGRLQLAGRVERGGGGWRRAR